MEDDRENDDARVQVQAPPRKVLSYPSIHPSVFLYSMMTLRTDCIRIFDRYRVGVAAPIGRELSATVGGVSVHKGTPIFTTKDGKDAQPHVGEVVHGGGVEDLVIPNAFDNIAGCGCCCGGGSVARPTITARSTSTTATASGASTATAAAARRGRRAVKAG
jgi:hypothetical protein